MNRNGKIFAAYFGAVLIVSVSGVPIGGSVPIDSDVDVTASIRVIGPGKPVPKGGGIYRVGDPYVKAGRTYVPREDPHYRAEGIASWYGDWFHGRLTANGEIYDMKALTAAHPTLPLPSYVRVTNLENNLSMVVRVNDRGPFYQGRIIDLSVRAAKLLRFYEHGLARVRVEYLGPASLEGSDDKSLAATLRREDPARAEAAAHPRPEARFPAQPVLFASVPEVDVLTGLNGRRYRSAARNATDDRIPALIFD